LCGIWTLTGIDLGILGIGLGGLGDMLLFRALFLPASVEFGCEACVCCS